MSLDFSCQPNSPTWRFRDGNYGFDFTGTCPLRAQNISRHVMEEIGRQIQLKLPVTTSKFHMSSTGGHPRLYYAQRASRCSRPSSALQWTYFGALRSYGLEAALRASSIKYF